MKALVIKQVIPLPNFMCCYKDVTIPITEKALSYIDDKTTCYVTKTKKNLYIEATHDNRKMIEAHLLSVNSKKHPSAILEGLLLNLFLRRRIHESKRFEKDE